MLCATPIVKGLTVAEAKPIPTGTTEMATPVSASYPSAMLRDTKIGEKAMISS